MSNDIKVYTLDEIAAILHITKRTIYTYVKEGKLKGVKIGKYWRVSEKQLEEFLSTGTEVSEANRSHGKR